jgi:hypothetical protein
MTCLLSLASLGAMLGADVLEHTDDGCAVEVHCIACRTLHGAAAVPMPSAPVCVRLESAGRVAGQTADRHETRCVRRSAPRAPPLV